MRTGPVRRLPPHRRFLVELERDEGEQASDDLPQNVNFAIKAGTFASFLDANRVTYQTGAPGKALEPADIADQARAMSGFVVCR